MIDKYIVNSYILESRYAMCEECHVSYEADYFAQYVRNIVAESFKHKNFKDMLMQYGNFNTNWFFIPLKHSPSEHPKAPEKRERNEFMFQYSANGLGAGHPIFLRFINDPNNEDMAGVYDRTTAGTTDPIKMYVNIADINSLSDLPKLYQKIQHECVHSLDMYILPYNKLDKEPKSKIFLDKKKDKNIFNVYMKDEDWLHQFLYFLDPSEQSALATGVMKFIQSNVTDRSNYIVYDLKNYRTNRDKVNRILQYNDVQDICQLDIFRAKKDDFIEQTVIEKLPTIMDPDYSPLTDYEFNNRYKYNDYRSVYRILIVGYYLASHEFFSEDEKHMSNSEQQLLEMIKSRDVINKFINNVESYNKQSGFKKIIEFITDKVEEIFLDYQNLIYQNLLHVVTKFNL